MALTVDNCDEAVARIESGDSVAIAGFLGCGTPKGLVAALARRGVRDLHVIASDSGRDICGPGPLVAAGMVRKLTVSHIGTNPRVIDLWNRKLIEVEFVPQGTFAERLRCAGAGLGGVLTATGVGTQSAEGKTVIELDGRKWLLEPAIRPKHSLIQADRADELGNLMFRRTARNHNPGMAMAAECSIVEVDRFVPVGSLDPEHVQVPFPFVGVMCPKETGL